MSETIVGFCVCDNGPDHPVTDCGIPAHRDKARRARLDEFEARPAAEEACVERVALAIHDAWATSNAIGMGLWREMAVAAIDAMRPASDAPRTGGRL